MIVKLTSRGVAITSELRDYVERRTSFSLGRFAGRIRRIVIRLSDANGPKGGVDQCCDVLVDAGLRQELFIREQQPNIYSAVALAVARAESQMKRRLSIENQVHRPIMLRPSFSE